MTGRAAFGISRGVAKGKGSGRSGTGVRCRNGGLEGRRARTGIKTYGTALGRERKGIGGGGTGVGCGRLCGPGGSLRLGIATGGTGTT